MCVKTKTRRGCGCSTKTLTPCDNAPNSRTPCSQVEKYLFLEDGDCKDCKAGGANVTRGQDGLGRYAREIAAREKKSQMQSAREVLGEITGNGSQSGLANNDKAQTPIVVPDPWMKPTRREKEWESPNRRHADEQWEREHAKRKEDIESLFESHSSSPKRKSHSRRIAAPVEHTLPYEVQDPLVLHHQRRNSGSLQSKVQQINNTIARSNRPHHSRHDSFESIESVPSRGRSRTLPFQYGYASDFGYVVENRAPRDAYNSVYGTSPVAYRRR